MRFYLNKMAVVLFFLCCIAYLGCVVLGYDMISEYIRSFISPMLLLYYITKKPPKSVLTLFFLIFYAVAETSFLYLEYSDLSYYVANIAYITSYGLMLVFLMSKMNFSKVIKRFSVHLIVLLLFGGYLLFALDRLSERQTTGLIQLDYALYTVYNSLFILVLMFSLIHYLYHDTKKTLILFLACLCIALSELVQIADIVDMKTLFIVLYSFLLIAGFCLLFFYFKNIDKTRSIVLEENFTDDT